MAMTPRDARTVQFTEDRRGYAQNEVHEYQERVAEALRLYETEVARLKARIEQSDERIHELEDAEDAVRRTFVAAAQTKREMLAEAEAEAARVRREADEAAAALRATTDEQTSSQRAAAQAEASRLVEDARRSADQARTEAAEEVRRLERRMLQLRTSITDLEERLSEFARRALDELSVAGSMIDLETAELEDMEHFAPEGPADAPVSSPEVAAPAPGSSAEPATEPPAEDAPVEEPAPAPVQAAFAAPPPVDQPAPPGPAVGIPARKPVDVAVPELDDEAEGSFYERRLAGLRRRIESASDD